MRTFIVVFWKETGLVEVYSSLRGFLERNKGFKADTINSYISRKKTLYEDSRIRLYRCKVIERL